MVRHADRCAGAGAARVVWIVVGCGSKLQHVQVHCGSMGTPRVIKVFIASPGDLAVERRAFKDKVTELNNGFGRGADVVFDPLGWEDALSQVGRRSQAVINRDVDACDVFVLVMWRRWGQEAPDAVPYSSYTEEEFYRALARFEKTGSPVIFVFFKHIDPGQMADAGPQLTKVLEFRKKLEQTRTVLYRSFVDDAIFREEVDRHLVAYARGEVTPPGGIVHVPVIPDSIAAEVDKHKTEAQRAIAELAKLKAEAVQAQQEAEAAKAQAKDATTRAEAAEQLVEAKLARRSIDLAEKAAKAALDGRIEEARQDFAKALDGTTNLQVLYLGYEFFQRIGELDEAERLMRRWLSISGPDAQTADSAEAYGNLGLIEKTRGNLDVAEIYHTKSLTIEKKLGRQRAMADQYGSLGLIEITRGNLDVAETYHRKSLTIEEKLGRQRGMADQYGNLGLIEEARGNFDAAEIYLKKSLTINRKLGRHKGIATQYNNLGLIEQSRGNLDVADAYLKKALVINEKIGRQQGIAIQYGNLGVIELARGNLDAAEAYIKKALAIDEKLGEQEGIATDYFSIGNIQQQRGNMDEARRFWILSRDLFKKIGAKNHERSVQLFLDDAQ